jgi:hypothetical protein
MRPLFKVALVAGGYVGALLLASLAVAIRVATTSGRDAQASSGMHAFGDAVVFAAVFAVCALLPTAAAFVFLRPYRRFWTVISALVVVAATGIAAALLFGAGGRPALSPLATAVPVDDEAVLVELQQVLAAAWTSGDRAAIERIIAPGWTSTGPDGSLTDRATVLAQVFETGAHRIRRLEIDDVEARVFGDAAVVTGRTHGVGEFNDTPYDVVIRFTDTFVRRDGRWQAVASHASLVQP